MEQLRMVTKINNEANAKFMSREPIVLLPTVCLMLLRGVGSNVDLERFYSHVELGQLSNAFNYYYVMQTFASFLGMMLVPFISEIHGRKPVFILLFTLALLSSILSYVPYQKPWPMIENFIVATLKGGVLTITALAICEYCSPKHRFAWLVASEVMKIFSANVTSILYSQNILSKESSYVSLCEVLVAVVCLVCLYWWPESPYWLASQGRIEESKAALLWLRREGDAARAELTALETARRRPSLKLFWLSILISILAVTVAQCASSEHQILTNVNQELETVKIELSHRITIVCANVVISILFVIISYQVSRKSLYLTAAIIPLILVYTLSIWLCAKQVDNHKEAFNITTLICNSLLECGPFNLSFALFIEAVPQKYYTYLSCISSLYFYGTSFVFPTLNIVYRESFPLYLTLMLFATLSLVASGVFYGLSEETSNKNLLEIEKKYLTRLYHDNHNHELVQVVELEDDSRL